MSLDTTMFAAKRLREPAIAIGLVGLLASTAALAGPEQMPAGAGTTIGATRVSVRDGLSRIEDRAAAAEASLRAALDDILRTPELDHATVGIHVRSLTDGRTIFEKSSGKLFNPASNIKLVTSAAALWYLGPSYRFKTVVLRDPRMSGGRVHGNLYVKGFGDPLLRTEELFGLANEIALLGIERVDGDLIVDDTFFDEVFEGPGWDQERSDQTYAPPIGALSANFSAFTVRVVPGDQIGGPARVFLWPDVPSIELASQVDTIGRGSRAHVFVGTSEEGQKLKVTVRGVIGANDVEGATIYRRVNHPSMFAGETVMRVLQLRGIEFKGKVKLGKIPTRDAVVIATQVSPPLADILSTLNKFSNNFIAEQVLKTLGAEVRGAPGTWAKGCEVASGFLEEIGIAKGTYVLGNGSGLNDVNRMTPAQLTRILEAMYRRFELHPEFVASLAVAGSSGTIRSRFDDGPAAQRLRAKTGSLRGVSSLSGYVATKSNSVVAFSVIMNDYTTRASAMREIQDRIGNALAEYQSADVLARP